MDTTDKIAITVEYDVTTRGTYQGDTATLRKCLVEKFTSPEGSVFEDYGVEAWGGYDGAYVTAARIVETEPTIVETARKLATMLDQVLDNERAALPQDEHEGFDQEFRDAYERAFDNIDHIVSHLLKDGNVRPKKV